MNATAILEKLREDSKTNVANILKDASDRAERMKSASNAKISAMKAETERRAEGDAAVAEQRMRRMEELEQRKRLLSAKRELISDAFARALAKMEAMPAEQARAFLLSTVTETAGGCEEVIIGADHREWFDDTFISACNEALTAVGKPGALTLAGAVRPGVSGLILAKDNTEINCTYAALLDSRRLELEADVADVLFPAD